MANKVHTLRRKSDFDLLKNKGKRIYLNQWLILNYLENAENQNRFGWTIPNKVGGAVLRNKIKRWCREFFRDKELHSSKHYDVNVIIRASGDVSNLKKISSQEFFKELESAIKKFR